jgi:hypothetical protein
MQTPTHLLLRTLLPEHTVTRLSPDGVRAQTADGSDVTVWWFRTAQQARTVVTALEMLHGKQAIPSLRGADIAGTITQRPAVIVDSPIGTPLTQCIDRLTTPQRHALGRQLGHLVADIHQHPASHYGPLAAPGFHSHAALLRARIAEAGNRLVAEKILDRTRCDALTAVIGSTVDDDSAHACLIHGAIGPESIWVDRTGQQVTISAFTQWNSAFGGRPAAEHVRLADACADDAYFALRIGYGEVYDERSQRPIDQHRERSLLPERLTWMFSRAAHAATQAQTDEAHRLLTVLQRWCDAIHTSPYPTEEE